MSSSNPNNSSRKGKGCQRVNMAKIENEANLQVTFSKRRAGLFKKASELSTLCGAETAIVVFSPGNKAHSFGHPSVKAVSSRFLGKNITPKSDAENLLDAHRNANIRQHTMELNQIESQLEVEKKRAKELEQMMNKDAINNLDYQQLNRLKGSILNFRQKLETEVQNATDVVIPEIPGSSGPAGANAYLTIPYSSNASSSTVAPMNPNDS